MKTYFIDFTVHRSDGSVVLSETFSTTSQSFNFASSILESDLILLNGLLPVDFYLIYNLAKIYSHGE